MSQVIIHIRAAETPKQAGDLIPEIAYALTLAHANALREVIRCSDARDAAGHHRAWSDAQRLLQAQAALGSIELFLGNEQVKKQQPPTGPAKAGGAGGPPAP